MDFRETILELIELKQEGGYWDFKKQWYDSKDDLLHDIICMANNLLDKDAYIIIGIDEENNFSIKEVSTDNKRKNTQNMVDFLKNKEFAGDVRPVVKVESLEFSSGIVDVIIIKNSMNTPFYLKERYMKLNPNYIYTRIQDTNTPIDKSADIGHIEWLWKKRLGLHLNPLQRISLYIEKYKDWSNSPNGEMEKYFNLFPEYKITYDFAENSNYGHKVYLFNQTNSNPCWMEIELYYHETLLMQFRGISLDGGRYFTPCPRIDGFSVGQYYDDKIYFDYMDQDSFVYKLNEFFYRFDINDESIIARRKFFDIVLLFENEDERKKFKYYAFVKWEEYKEKYEKDINVDHIPQFEIYTKDAFKQEYKNSMILKKMLDEYRKGKN